MINIKGIPRSNRNVQFVVHEEKKYTEIPEVYNTKEQWIKKCNLNCYHCTCKFSHIPIFNPVSKDENGFYRGSGPIYCSPFCSVMYCEDISQISMLRNLIYTMTKIKFLLINPSDDRSVLRNFGGWLTKKEYQEKLIKANLNYYSNL